VRFPSVATAVAVALLYLPIGGVLPTIPSLTDDVTLQTIHGRVTDTIGRPLTNVTVSDGNHVAYTDTNGAYSIGEMLPGSYQITASRLGLDPIPPRTVDPVQAQEPVDFVATYRLGASLSSTESRTDITVVTYTPRHPSCAFWQDGSDGTVLALTATGDGAEGTTTWTGHYAVDGWSTGKNTATAWPTAWATDCDGHLLSRVQRVSYVVATA
jgi:hypothetical protein